MFKKAKEKIDSINQDINNTKQTIIVTVKNFYGLLFTIIALLVIVAVIGLINLNMSSKIIELNQTLSGTTASLQNIESKIRDIEQKLK